MAINPVVPHVNDDLLPPWLMKQRTRVLTKVKTLKSTTTTTTTSGSSSIEHSVVYWMQRDVRTVDNWALLFAMHLAQRQQVPLHVIYVLPPPPSQASAHQADVDELSKDPEWLPPALAEMAMTERFGLFLLGGLEQVHDQLQQHHVPLHVLLPQDGMDHVGDTIQHHVIQTLHPLVMVCDFTPIRHLRQALEQQTVPLFNDENIPIFQVDAHNIVPVWTASMKREVGARTLRPKLHKVVHQYLTNTFPPFVGNDHMVHATTTKATTTSPNKDSMMKPTKFHRQRYERFMHMDPSVPVVAWAQPGTNHAMEQFKKFIKEGLPKFDQLRNDPNHKNISSNLSPWLNHGHVSFQRLALQVKALNQHANGTAAYIEEGFVRRELSDNCLFYAPNDYDALSGAATWAQDSLQLHASDDRDPLYSCYDLEHANTYDDLWNAAQLQLVREGKLHGFLRMYWAKKILEWTISPRHALEIAQYFNDRYALDGRDPNGFVGVGWSIMGIHDMGWKERPIFGKIRYMNYAGCKRKFDVAAFVRKYPPAAANAVQAIQPQQQQQPQGGAKKTSTRKSSKDAPATTSNRTNKTPVRQQTLTQAFASPKATQGRSGKKRKAPPA